MLPPPRPSRVWAALAALLTLLSLLLILRGAPPPATAAPGGAAWLTIANGDDVRRLTRIDGALWAATQAGGAVRWDGIGHYRQYLHPQDGLAANDVRAIVKHDGKVWFATSRGLSALDADGRWTTYTQANTGGGLPYDNVTALASAADGSLWVGTQQQWDGRAWRGGGLARLKDGQWQTFTPADGLGTLNITDLAVLPDGRVWAVGEPYRVWVPPADPAPGFWQANGGGASVFAGGQWTAYQRNPDSSATLPNTDVFYGAAADVSGRVWFAASTGLLMFGPQGWRAWTVTGGGSAANGVTAVTVTVDGTVWLAVTDPSGVGLALSILDPHGTPEDPSDDTWRTYPTANFPGSTIAAILPNGSDEVWLGLRETTGNGSGLLRVAEDGAPLEQRLTYGLRSNFISALGVAPDGGVWIGTGDTETLGKGRGLHILAPDGSWAAYQALTPSDTAAATLSRAVAKDDALLYVAANDPAALQAALGAGFTLGDDPTRYTFQGLYPQGSESLLVFQPSVTRDFPAGTALYPIIQTIGSDTVSGIAFAPDGTAWITARGQTIRPEQGGFIDGGLSRYTPRAAGNRWTLYRKGTASLPSNDLSAVAIGPDGRVWVGSGSVRDSTGGGLTVLAPASGQWTSYHASDGLASEVVTGLVATPEGDIWVASAPYWSNGVRSGGGVSLLRSGTWTSWTPQTSRLLADYSDVRALGRDRKGGIWAGAWHYEGPSLLNDWPAVMGVANRYAGGEWASWTFPRDGWTTAIAAAPDGKLWVGMSRGGYEPDPSQGGLWVWNGTTWQRLDRSTGLPDNDIQALAVAPDGTVWVGTVDHGLSRYSPSGAPLPTVEPPTPTATRPRPPTLTPTATLSPTPTTTPGPRVPRAYLPLIVVSQVVSDATPAPTPTPGMVTPRPTATATRGVTLTPTPTRPANATTVPPGTWTVETVGSAAWRAVAFRSPDEGWAVGDSGALARYQGGQWTLQDSPTRANLRAVSLASAASSGAIAGWAVGDGGVVLAYEQGTWRAWSDDSLPVHDWRAVAVTTDGTSGWLVSSDSTFARLTNGHWRVDPLAPGNTPGLRALALTPDGRFGVAVGDLGRLAVLRGDADPPYWDTPGAPINNDLYAAALLPNGSGWAGGDYPALLRYPSQDCGSRPAPCWSLETSAPHVNASLRGLALADTANGWAVGLRGHLYRWDGRTWQAQPSSPTEENLNSVALLSARSGWAVGDNGIILKYASP